jgi:hypothetical protein
MKKQNFTLEIRGENRILITLNKGNSGYYPYEPINEYIEVSAEFDRKNFKVTEFSYRLLRNPQDNLANWQGREQAINYYVGETAILAAEKLLQSHIKGLKKVLAAGKSSELWQALKPIAERKLEYYKDDFFYHDAMNISSIQPKNLIWMVRQSGTWFIYHKNDYNRAILDQEVKEKQHEIYYWNGSKLAQININEAKGIYNQFKD